MGDWLGYFCKRYPPNLKAKPVLCPYGKILLQLLLTEKGKELEYFNNLTHNIYKHFIYFMHNVLSLIVSTLKINIHAYFPPPTYAKIRKNIP